MEYCMRLFDFNVYNAPDPEKDDQEFVDNNVFMIQMFGIDETGASYSVVVEGYRPFFYVKVGDHWTIEMKDKFIVHLKEKMGKYYKDSITDGKLIRRKKMVGFDNKKDHKFIYLEFANHNAFKRASNLWYSSYESGHTLLKEGYVFMNTKLELYEANIPPLLRFFHVKDMSPTGWIAIPKKKAVVREQEDKTVNCTYQLSVHMKNIVPINERETLVPFKVMSMDIEADSSHGDFPVPIKTYKKLAINIVEYLENHSTDGFTKENMNQLLRDIICCAFGFEPLVQGIDIVYPKNPPKTVEELESMIQTFLKSTVRSICTTSDFQEANALETIFEQMRLDLEKEASGEEGDDEDGEDGSMEVEQETYHKKRSLTQAYSNKTATISDLLLDKEYEREGKLNELNRVLNAVFPKLEGDKVTFIGSTIMNYGNKDPHFNHCIVLGNCSPLPNCVIESYSTEKEVLLAWQNLVQRENPDFIIGYNIFGFDYEFMFRRAEENDCVEEFLKLSRNKDEICGTRDQVSGRWKIEESSIRIASGQHDLRYIKMNGRCQIDLYNFYRRSENLSSYKLDYVGGHFIGDYVKTFRYSETDTTICTGNLTGLLNGNYIHIEEIGHSVDYYRDGDKFKVFNVDKASGTFTIEGLHFPDQSKKIRWCLAKDDVTPKDIFRLTNGTDDDRAIVAKYCIQDCNLVHYLFNKSDILTGFVEMGKICSVPISFLVMRGQGIKLQSLIACECRKLKTLMPVLEKGDLDEGYEGADVLEPKTNLYMDIPVACNDYASLYPSSMISENLSHDSKVWTKEYDLAGNLIAETGEKDAEGRFIYDNLPEYEYVTVTYDTFRYFRRNPKAAPEKIRCGHKACRFVQFPDGESAIIPMVLKKLLKARKDTRALQKKVDKDDFLWGVLEQRQLGCKVSANSIYGGCGAKTSTFYEKDIAASTTAMGRKFLRYGKRIIEECYGNGEFETTHHGRVRTNAEYIYGDTDSVFYTFNLKEMDGTPIYGRKALEITIELAQQAGELAASFLKPPHDFEYEKTFMPFCLLSKKRYVGMLYETDPTKCKRKEMGVVLKRRDNAPIVKDIYGGIIDILMKKQNIEEAVAFLSNCLQQIIEEKYPMEKLVITKSLRSGYKNPKAISHKVLADRMMARDPGNKLGPGDRIPYAYICVKNKKALQGEKIEHPAYIIEHNLKLDYAFYITNQIMKPVQQLFALVIEKIWTYQKKFGLALQYKKDIKALQLKLDKTVEDEEERRVKFEKKLQELRCKAVKELLFDNYLREINNTRAGNQSIECFLQKPVLQK